MVGENTDHRQMGKQKHRADIFEVYRTADQVQACGYCP
jgi:hypothetical protein